MVNSTNEVKKNLKRLHDIIQINLANGCESERLEQLFENWKSTVAFGEYFRPTADMSAILSTSEGITTLRLYYEHYRDNTLQQARIAGNDWSGIYFDICYAIELCEVLARACCEKDK